MLGYLIAYIIGTIFEDWRDSALALLTVSLLGSLTMVLFPETPFWLASVGRLQDSRLDYFTHLNMPGQLASLDEWTHLFTFIFCMAMGYLRFCIL